MVDSVADKLADPALLQMLMEPIMQKWATLTDEDRKIYSLLECVSSIAVEMQKAFVLYTTPQVFERCVYFIESTLNKALTADLAANRLREEIISNGSPTQLAEVKKIDTPEKDILLVAVDLLSELTEALDKNIQPLVGANNSKLIQLLYFCVNDPNVEVRQSAFGLLDVRGFKDNENKVDLEGEDIVIQAEYKEENDNESVQSSFCRRLTIPKDVKKESIKCDLDENGRLVIFALKLAIENSAEKRSIPIEFKMNDGAASVENK